MSHYHIELPHTETECLESRKELQSKGPEVLDKYYWGCSTGQHVGWAVVEAQNESAAREIVPHVVQNKARITRVEKLTAGDLNLRRN